MELTEIKDTDMILEDVTCVYCHQIMGRQRKVRKTDPATGRASFEIIA